MFVILCQGLLKEQDALDRGLQDIRILAYLAS